MADTKLVGVNYSTPELRAKVTGRSKYAEDFRAEGMLFARLVLSPYAHARISSVLRGAADLGLDWRAVEPDLSLLDHERETALLGVIGELPRIVGSAAELREPHRVARYLEELATAYHKFYDSCRVLPRGDEEPTPTHAARLVLCSATRQVLANGLALLGVSAPERM